MTERMFPILKDACIVAIPWAAIAPFEKQAFENHSQTLERLAQRGGLGPNEAACIIMGKSVFREPIRSKSYWRAVLMHKVNSTLHSMEAEK
jgi:hypothetical protein